MFWNSRRRSARSRGLAEGYRSGLEERIAQQLDQLGIQYWYERYVLKYTPKARQTRYTPDFVLPNGIVIESKGRFVSKDRTKHKDIANQNPDLDLRFVFSNPNAKIGKRSQTTYAMWCDRNGFMYAQGEIPEEWIDEKPCPVRLDALAKLQKKE